MKAPLSWLKDYVDIDVSPEELQKKLFSCGFEVEELIYLGKEISRCVVGQITNIEKHPDSDHLQICKLNCGSFGKDIQIVTGAQNIKLLDKVPVALDGSTLYNGVKIKKGKLRGVESNGMLCSGEELGINDDYYEGADVYGILILDKDTIVGTDIKEVVGLDDYIFDIGVTANRPDCQCIYGIAREVASVLNKPLKPLNLDYKTDSLSTSKRINIEVEAPDLCPRYIGHYVKDIKIEKSPSWMRKRLALCDLRGINNIVDITNFILLEMGQPMHAFDLSTIDGNKIIVRRAKNNEKITTLDEKEFKLNASNLVICDESKPVALAGIMGGLNSEIKPETSEVLFECAKFVRDSVRKTSRSLGQRSDSSSRYEKGVDAYTTGVAIKRALHFISELNWGKIANDEIDICADKVEGKKLVASVSKINALLGITVPAEQMAKILTSLQFKVEINDDAMLVTCPAFREDIDGYPDLAEEIIRMYGYDNIVSTFLAKASITNGGLNYAQKLEKNLKNTLVAQGYSEMVSYSFISSKDYDALNFPADDACRNSIKIINPIGEDLSLMRTTLAPSMVNAIVHNIRKGNYGGRLFETAKIYLAKELPIKDGDMPEEIDMVSIGCWGDDEDFFTAKGAVEAIAYRFGVKFSYEKAEKCFLHPGKTANILLNDKVIGYIGELAPNILENFVIDKKVYVAELNYQLLTESINPDFKYVNNTKYFEIERDLALLVDEEITCADIENEIYKINKTISDVTLFDVYRGGQVPQGKKSMAFRLKFSPIEKAMDANDVENCVKKILKNLKFKFNIDLR